MLPSEYHDHDDGGEEVWWWWGCSCRRMIWCSTDHSHSLRQQHTWHTSDTCSWLCCCQQICLEQLIIVEHCYNISYSGSHTTHLSSEHIFLWSTSTWDTHGQLGTRIAADTNIRINSSENIEFLPVNLVDQI